MTDDFTSAYRLYQASILHYCFCKCHDREVGQDLTQETFLCYYLTLQKNQEIFHPRAFLYRIAHNRFINYVSRKKEASLDHLLEAGFEPAVDLWHQTYSRLDAERPLRKLRTMNPTHRRVLQQRFIQGLTPGEIANLTGETSNTVSVRIFRALKTLRSMLEEKDKSAHPSLIS